MLPYHFITFITLPLYQSPSFAEISSILLIGFTAFSAISGSTVISGDSSFKQL